MANLTEKNFEDIKEQLLLGLINPAKIGKALFAFIVVELIFIGLASFIVMANNSVIGWDGLPLFWQGALIASYIFIFIQLLATSFLSGKTSGQHAILLIVYLFSMFKLSYDGLILNAVIFMDQFIYEEMASVLMTIFVIGIILFIGFLLHAFYRRTSEKTYGIHAIHAILSVIATIVTVIIFHKPLFELEQESIILVIANIIIYYGLMAAAVLPFEGLYTYIKLPSFRMNQNKEQIEEMIHAYEKEEEEMEEQQNKSPISLHILQADQDKGITLEENEMYEIMHEVILENHHLGAEDELSIVEVGVYEADNNIDEEVWYLIINRTREAIKEISFTLHVETKEQEAVFDHIPIQFTEKSLGLLEPNHAIPLILPLDKAFVPYMMDHETNIAMKDLTYR